MVDESNEQDVINPQYIDPQPNSDDEEQVDELESG